jgi:hypothetical protein
MTTTINASTSSGLVNTADTSGILQLQTASTAALTIDASQNVGIGTASPTQKLQVAGSQLLASPGNSVYTYFDGTPTYVGRESAAGSLVFGVNSSERMRIDSSGNVKVANSTAVSGTNNVGNILCSNDISTGSFLMGVNGSFLGRQSSDGSTILNTGQANIIFSNGTYGSTTERMRIDSSGRLIVGLTTPYDNATFCVTSPVGQNRIIGFDGGGSGARARFFVDAPAVSQINLVVDGSGTMGFVQNTVEMARFDSNRNFLVGRTATTPYTNVGFTVTSSGRTEITRVTGGDAIAFYCSANGNNVGTIVTNVASTSYNTTSDYRLKENIAPMIGALATVTQLKPVTYKWKADGSDGQGFIAHELQAVVPDCVTGEKDAVETYTDEDGNEQTRPKYQGIDVSFLVATLTAAIQELKAINDTQAETINALTARIVALEK